MRLFVSIVLLGLSVSPASAFQPVSCYFKSAQESWLINGRTMRRLYPEPALTYLLADHRRRGHTDTWSITIGDQPLSGGLEVFDGKAAGWSVGTGTTWAHCDRPLSARELKDLEIPAR